MNKVLHKQLAYNILANGTHMAQDLSTAGSSVTSIMEMHSNKQVPVCSLPSYQQNIKDENRMSKGEGHTLLVNNADVHAPAMHAPEPCRAHANDNCAHLVSSASQLVCCVAVKEGQLSQACGANLVNTCWKAMVTIKV